MAQFLCLDRISTHIPAILQESGHYLFQYGRYEECIDNNALNYNLIALGLGDQDLGIFIGMCLPKICTSKIIQNSLNKLFQAAKAPVSILSVQSNIQHYQLPYTSGFYLTIALLIILTLLVAVASITYKERWPQLRSFALQRTIKVFERKEGSELNVFNGVRAFAMMWVVIGHVYLNSLGSNVNTPSIQDVFQKPFTLIISAGLLSVDVFFCLGGFFMAFVFLRDKTKSLAKYPLAVLHRVLRIWPCYIITMLIYYTVFMHLGSGPRWSQNEPIVEMCSDMWRSMLFVDNFVNNGDTQCLPWGWYLQVDFQVFLVCLFLLLLYSYNKKASLFAGLALIVSSMVFNIIFTQQHEIKLFTNVEAFINFLSYFQSIYIKPYGRWSPYIFGLFLGIIYSEYKASLKSQAKRPAVAAKCHQLKAFLETNRIGRLGVQLFGIGIMAFLAFIPRTLQNGGQWPQILHSLYLYFSRILFNVGLMLMLLPTLLGVKGSFVMNVLDTALFNYLGKISFCAYLIHYVVLSQVLAVQRTDTYFDIPQRFVYHLGILVITCFLATLMVLIIEAPFANIQKELLKMVNPGKKKANQQSAILKVESTKWSEQTMEDSVKPLNASEALDRNSTIQDQQ